MDSPGAGPSTTSTVHLKINASSQTSNVDLPMRDGDDLAQASSRTHLPSAGPSPSHRDTAPNPQASDANPGQGEGQAKQASPPKIKVFEVYCECQPSEDGRNLVACIDGTANQFGYKNTNVVELYSRLDKDKTQLTYYNSGIGTYVKDSNWVGRGWQKIANSWDMAVAWNLKKIILHAYQWLSDHYEPGDCMFLFSFSRGAYQVRIISGMIDTVGLLPKGNHDQIAFAYELYLSKMAWDPSNRSWLRKLFYNKVELEDADVRTEEVKARTEESKARTEEPEARGEERTKKLCEQFKRTLSHDHAKVHFVGVWDTVSSVGITRGPSFPETTDGMTHVCGCRHALSLNEDRGKFLPEYVNGGAGPGSYFRENRDRVKEVWFVGSHSDIGGGNSVNIDNNNFGPSLRWMLYEALQYGLKVKLDLKGWGYPTPQSSMTWIWRIFEIYPFRRLTYKDEASTKRWPPHLGRGRRMQDGQMVHASVIRYMQEHSEYTPAARHLHSMLGDEEVAWSEIRDSMSPFIIVEKDADAQYAPTINILKQLRDAAKHGSEIVDEALKPFVELISTLRGGCQLILDAAASGSQELLFDALKYAALRHGTSLDSSSKNMITAITQALSRISGLLSSPENVPSPKYLKGTLCDWLEGADPQVSDNIIKVFGKESLDDPIPGHWGVVLSVIYSPDGKYIASGSSDKTVRLWDAETGHPVGEPLQGHTGPVKSVAFSCDGRRVASGSGDDSIRVWDVETQQAIGSPIVGHKDDMNSVAFSPDGTCVVSGSDDKTVRVWDTQTGLAVGEPLRGHSNLGLSVAFSPDGTRIASGAGDETIRIWDAATHEEVKVLEGHSDWVRSVVFSPDGKRVISGSLNRTIRVWDIETGKMVLGPLHGHDGPVYTVAVSPDGRYIASGSSDKTVRLWNAETGEAAGKPLEGHTGPVGSVAFSPDSQRVVSSSGDKTLRIWEIPIEDGGDSPSTS